MKRLTFTLLLLAWTLRCCSGQNMELAIIQTMAPIPAPTLILIKSWQVTYILSLPFCKLGFKTFYQKLVESVK